ncbi:T6SS effector amidase Tae4 family protein [Olleya aquimaris]|uniref:Type VI secretion system (T6SS) effector Tae4 (Amidase) n=1 Tax=Olleya aquimaris TaxID=639310 RepID=A0A327RLF7_9FLAO|nr:T6SS effector amidase Tae4 family protein [Olleya aquimaris]RAJ17035.1 type VI secretion system (T6SS) effector Tae4 (amidase) [Olleya aquimaris]
MSSVIYNRWNNKSLVLSKKVLGINNELDPIGLQLNLLEKPTWKTMKASYPGKELPPFDLYKEIGGNMPNYKSAEELSRSPYANSCAFRMSRGLNLSGVILPKRFTPNQLVRRGKDKNYYWGRVKELYPIMKEKLGEPDLNNKLKSANYGEVKQGLSDLEMTEYKNKKGIIMFEVSGWGDATGHFTLWDGNNLIYPGNPDHDNPNSELYYFKMKYDVNDNGKKKVVQTSRILLWELK